MAVTRQPATTSAAQVLAADGARYSVILTNDDANRAYVLVGPGTASTTNYSFSIAQYDEKALVGHERMATERISVIWGTAGAGGLNATSL
jgi:hypothetical protein